VCAVPTIQKRNQKIIQNKTQKYQSGKVFGRNVKTRAKMGGGCLLEFFVIVRLMDKFAFFPLFTLVFFFFSHNSTEGKAKAKARGQGGRKEEGRRSKCCFFCLFVGHRTIGISHPTYPFRINKQTNRQRVGANNQEQKKITKKRLVD
jgi:hypothetical protein